MSRRLMTLGILALVSVVAPSARSYAEDRPATKAEVVAAFTGKTVDFGQGGEGGTGTYGADGSYQYTNTYNASLKSAGTYAVTEDGKMCVAFKPKGARCDQILTDGSHLKLQNGQGQVYPLEFR